MLLGNARPGYSINTNVVGVSFPSSPSPLVVAVWPLPVLARPRPAARIGAAPARDEGLEAAAPA